MNRAEATPVDGSRSTTEPPASTEVVVPAGGSSAPAVRLRPPAPASSPHRGWAAVVPYRSNENQRAGDVQHPGEIPPDRLPVRRDEPEVRTGTGVTVIRRAGPRRGAVATRRVVGL
ncbi:hypothetical protein [Actinoplanes derwentensis]|nr:hypothetical protein [Actinoplanes derwentensis]